MNLGFLTTWWRLFLAWRASSEIPLSVERRQMFTRDE